MRIEFRLKSQNISAPHRMSISNEQRSRHTYISGENLYVTACKLRINIRLQQQRCYFICDNSANDVGHKIFAALI